MASILILAVCLGGLGMIVWWRVLQCRALGVPYLDPVRKWVFIGCGAIALGWVALLGYALAFQ